MKKALFLAIFAVCFVNMAFSGTLTLIAPDGGELCLGRRSDITWTATGIRADIKVKLLLFKDGVKIGTIAQDLDASGSPFHWTVGRHDGGTAAPGGGYKIRLRTMNNTVEDFDNAPFTIANCPALTVAPVSRSLSTRPFSGSATTVRVTNPNTRGAVTHGDEVVVTWEHANARPGQRLKVFAKRYTAQCHRETGFNQLTLLGSLPIEAGHVNWDVSPTFYPGYTYSIRLEPQVAGDFAADESDECFEVKSRTTIRVLEPNGGEVFSRGTPINIRLQMTHFEPRFMRVTVYLWRYDDACDSAILGTYCNGFDSNLTECSCQINADLPAGKYKISLDVYAGELFHPSATNPLARYASDSSDACFTIR